MEKKKLKTFKLNLLQSIKQTNKHLYIFRYYDLKNHEIINIKKKLKTYNFKILTIKQNLIKKIFPYIKSQNSILIIYGNNNLNIFETFMSFNKIELLFYFHENKIYSNLKLKQIIKPNIYLNHSITKPFLVFLYYLRNIKKANIT